MRHTAKFLGIGCRVLCIGKDYSLSGIRSQEAGGVSEFLAYCKRRIRTAFSHTLYPIPYTLIIAFLLSCSSDLELPPPPDSISSSAVAESSSSNEEQSSSSQAQNLFCVIGEQCLSNIAQDKCAAAGGIAAETCPVPSSSSQSGGISSSSVAVSSSSSIPEGSVLCLVGVNCTALTQEQCDILGGQAVSSCPVSSSSGEAVSSSSSIAESSSSEVAPSSGSNAGGVCDASTHTFTDPRDGKVYGYVKAGTQIWMTGNLNYSRENTIGWCYGADLTDYSELAACGEGYGRFYAWETAMDGQTASTSGTQGLCPSGWHIPSVAEWNALESQTSTNISNVSLKLGGNYNSNSKYPPLGWKERSGSSTETGYYWTSNNNSNFALVPDNIGLLETQTGATSSDIFSVRCIADADLECEYSSSSSVQSSSSVKSSSSSVVLSSSSLASSSSVIAGDDPQSSSSVVVSSSSSISEVSVLCLVGGNCIELTESQCSILGGQSVSSCPVSSSSSVLSSSSLASSSSVIAGDDPQSSSSVVVSSSSSFPASGTFIDGRDGQEYSYVTIGSQVWMSENLNYNASGSWCYDDNTSYCTDYGRLYDWATAMGISSSYNTSYYNGSDVNRQGVCPIGWHLPSDGEWDALATAVGGSSTAGTKLKAGSGWNSSGNGTDAYGFSALPGGRRYNDGSFVNVGSLGSWWSSTENDASIAYNRYLNCISADLSTSIDNKRFGFSVRCLRD